GDAFLAQGLTVNPIKLGSPEGKVKIDKGAATIVSLEGRSADMEYRVEGDVQLRDPVGVSSANLCVLFRPTAALTKREVAFELLPRGLDQMAKRADGFYGIRMSGRLDAMTMAPARCGGAGRGGGAPPPLAPAATGFAPSRPSPSFAPPPSVAAPTQAAPFVAP